MKAQIIRKLPESIQPHIQTDLGHFRVSVSSQCFSNNRRLVNLHNPERVTLAPQHYVQRRTV